MIATIDVRLHFRAIGGPATIFSLLTFIYLREIHAKAIIRSE